LARTASRAARWPPARVQPLSRARHRAGARLRVGGVGPALERRRQSRGATADARPFVDRDDAAVCVDQRRHGAARDRAAGDGGRRVTHVRSVVLVALALPMVVSVAVAFPWSGRKSISGNLEFDPIGPRMLFKKVPSGRMLFFETMQLIIQSDKAHQLPDSMV